MLDNNDRQQIIAIIQQTIASSLGSSKQSNKFQGTTYTKYGKASQKDWERQQREKEKKDRIAELEDKRRKGKDSLAQRLELAKLRSEEKLFGNISPEVKDLLKGTAKTTGKVAGGVATGVTAGALGTASAVRNSKLGSSLVSSMMMSNPLTAILYMNSDLISGTARGAGKIAKTLGKGALGTAGILGKGLFSGASFLYSLLRKPTATGATTPDGGSTTGTSLIPGQPKRSITTSKTNVMASTNYIMAKNAMLIGGKNYFYISLGGGFGGGLGGAMGGISRGAGAIAGATAGTLSGTFTPLLPGPTDGTQPSFAGGGRRMRNVTPKDDTSKSIVKGITGMHEQAKKSNELQKEANKKIAMIAGISLLAVAGIVALALALKDQTPNLPGSQTPTRMKNRTDSFVDTQNIGQLQPKGLINMLNKQYAGSTTKQTSGKQYVPYSKMDLNDETRKLLENQQKADLAGPFHQVTPLANTIRKFSTSGEGLILQLPVKIKLLDIEFSATQERRASIVLQKAEVTAGKREKLKTLTDSLPKLIITNVTKVLVPQNRVIPANTPICVVGKNYQIVGDLSAFMRGNKYEEYQNKWSGSAQATKNYLDFRRQEGVTAALLKDEESSKQFLDKRSGIAGTYAPTESGIIQTVKNIPQGTKVLGTDINVEPSNVRKAKNNTKKKKVVRGKTTGQASSIDNMSDELLEETKTPTINVSTPDTIFYSLPIEDTMKANAGLLGIQQ